MQKKQYFIAFVLLVIAALAAPTFVSSQTLQTTCTVSSVNAMGASVRTAPGNSGQVFTFLVGGRAYSVTGHTVASNGVEWWSLDRADFTRPLESDPWVSAAEVSTSGDCDAFTGSAEEISSTATPAAGTSIISVRATLRAGLGAGSALSVREGLWRLTLTNVAMNCGVGDPVFFGSQQADELISITPADASNSLIFDGNILQQDATGSYNGQFELQLVGRAFETDITLTIDSYTSMTGNLVAHLGNCNYESDVELYLLMDN